VLPPKSFLPFLSIQAGHQVALVPVGRGRVFYGFLSEVHSPQFPGLALTKAKAQIVLQKNRMIFSWGCGIRALGVGHGRKLGVAGEEKFPIEDGSQGNVPKISWGSSIINHSIRQHGEVVKPAFPEIAVHEQT